jgi:NitT/TauT family transport system substrate-binding protein
MSIFKRVRNGSAATPATTGVALTGLLALVLAGCGGGEPEDGGAAADGEGAGAAECDGGPAEEINIAYQPGLGYAPLLVAKQQETLEDALPDTEIEWLELNSGAAIRDGMLSDDIQVGSGGIGPFLVGYDSGIDWKVISGMNNMSLHLMAIDPAIESVEDLEGAGSIAMPGPDSIQSVVLRRAAGEQLGDARALDDQIVAMGHPDGVQALIGGQLAAHLTSPPFQSQEADEGARAILESYDVFGEHTFNSIFTLTEFASCNPEFVDALLTAVEDANTMLTDEPAEAAEILAAEFGIEAEVVEEQITAEGITFTATPSGFGTFAEFMQEIDLIGEVPETSELFFENEATQGAS